jgi:putative transposase
VFTENYEVYGARKIWRQLNREGIGVVRCTVERLMREMGIRGAIRGKRYKTTRPNVSAPELPDLVDRDFTASAPNGIWVADITYVRTWEGFTHVALVIDVFSRMTLGWSIASHVRTDLPLEALEFAIWRRHEDLDGLVHHSDRGSQALVERSSQHLEVRSCRGTISRMDAAADRTGPYAVTRKAAGLTA